MVVVTRGDWKTKPFPPVHESIALDRRYSPAEFQHLKEGHIPTRMEDKWFAYYEEPWLYLHRSWSGYCVYKVRFDSAGGQARVAEVLVNREVEQYRSTDTARDALLLAVRLDEYAGRDTQAAWQEFRASIGQQATD